MRHLPRPDARGLGHHAALVMLPPAVGWQETLWAEEWRMFWFNGLLIAAGLTVLIIYIFIKRYFPARRLSPGFEAHAESRFLGLTGRKWIRTAPGRELRAWYFVGGHVDIMMSCASRTRAIFLRTADIGRESRQIPGAVLHPIGEGLTCLTTEPAWVQRLVEAPRALSALSALLDHLDAHSVRFVILEPEIILWVGLHLPQIDLDSASVERWIAALKYLAEEVDRQPPPDQPVEATPIQRIGRTWRPGILSELGCGCLMVTLFIGPFAAGAFLMYLFP